MEIPMKTLSLTLIPLVAALASPMALAQSTTSATGSVQSQADTSGTAGAQEATPTPRTTGTQSQSGTTGSHGTHGQSGTSGTHGTHGQSGTTGTQDQSGTTGAQGQSGTTGTRGAQSSQLTWADVDTDGSGAISRSESSGMTGLSEVFDQADADGDGQLTPDEYRTFAAASGGASQDPASDGTD
jgi:hypothetical protein